MFLLKLFVEVVVVVLQEALAHSQLPYLFVLDDYLNRMLASFKVEFEVRISQRVLELGIVRGWLRKRTEDLAELH